MSTAPSISHPSFSVPLFTQLAHRLRHTNARYNLIAYQCRHTYHPTHHAKRRAYRAGLRIDTSKASPVSPILVFVSDTRTGHAAKTKEGAGDGKANGGVPQLTGGGLPETKCLSPLDIEIRIGLDGDGDRQCRGGVPGAPRLRPRPLPDADEFKTGETVPESSLGCARYDAVGLGITIPERHLKQRRLD